MHSVPDKKEKQKQKQRKTTKQNKKKKKGQKFGRIETRTAVPVRYSSRIEYKNRPFKDNVVRRTIEIASVKGDPGDPVTSNFVSRAVYLNPGLSEVYGKQVSDFAGLYDQYEIMSMRVEYDGTGATDWNGRISMAFDYDMNDELPKSRKEFSQYDGYKSCDVYNKTEVFLDKAAFGRSNPRKRYKVRQVPVEDYDLYDAGFVVLATEGVQNTMPELGFFHLTYVIRFYKTQGATTSLPAKGATSSFSTIVQDLGGLSTQWVKFDKEVRTLSDQSLTNVLDVTEDKSGIIAKKDVNLDVTSNIPIGNKVVDQAVQGYATLLNTPGDGSSWLSFPGAFADIPSMVGSGFKYGTLGLLTAVSLKAGDVLRLQYTNQTSADSTIVDDFLGLIRLTILSYPHRGVYKADPSFSLTTMVSDPAPPCIPYVYPYGFDPPPSSESKSRVTRAKTGDAEKRDSLIALKAAVESGKTSSVRELTERYRADKGSLSE